MVLLLTLYNITKEVFQVYDIEDLSSKEQRNYMLRDGYFFGIGAISISCYLLICSINWIFGMLNMLLFFMANFAFMQTNSWIKTMAHEYLICSLILTSFIVFMNYQQIKESKIQFLTK